MFKFNNMKKNFLFALFVLVSASMFAQVKVIAHRGYWKADGSAQNSLASFAKADSVGAFGSEFDVMMTSDGVIVLNHDNVFQGVDIQNSDYDSVKKLKLVNGEHIPSLDEFLSAMANTTKIKFILEIKSLATVEKENIAVSKIVESVKKHNLLDRVDYISFSLNVCQTLKKVLPEADIYYLEGDLAPDRIKEEGFAGIDYSVGALKKHPEWIKEAHDLGLKVNIWTVNSEENMKFAIENGVDFITTDYPELAKKLVSETGK